MNIFKAIKQLPKEQTAKITKDCVDGILEVILRMYEQRTEEERALTLSEFINKVLDMHYIEFSERSLENDWNSTEQYS